MQYIIEFFAHEFKRQLLTESRKYLSIPDASVSRALNNEK